MTKGVLKINIHIKEGNQKCNILWVLKIKQLKMEGS